MGYIREYYERIIKQQEARFNFTQKKTKGVEHMPTSQQALELCGKPRKPKQFVFEDLADPSSISRPL